MRRRELVLMGAIGIAGCSSPNSSTEDRTTDEPQIPEPTEQPTEKPTEEPTPEPEVTLKNASITYSGTKVNTYLGNFTIENNTEEDLLEAYVSCQKGYTGTSVTTSVYGVPAGHSRKYKIVEPGDIEGNEEETNGDLRAEFLSTDLGKQIYDVDPTESNVETYEYDRVDNDLVLKFSIADYDFGSDDIKSVEYSTQNGSNLIDTRPSDENNSTQLTYLETDDLVSPTNAVGRYRNTTLPKITITYNLLTGTETITLIPDQSLLEGSIIVENINASQTETGVLIEDISFTVTVHEDLIGIPNQSVILVLQNLDGYEIRDGNQNFLKSHTITSELTQNKQLTVEFGTELSAPVPEDLAIGVILKHSHIPLAYDFENSVLDAL